MKVVVFFLAVIMIMSCAIAKPASKGISNELIGRWCLTKNQTNYPTLVFEHDSLAVFESRADTVYGFKYYVIDRSLYLIQPTGKIEQNKILTFTKDSLSFESLLENKAVQMYYRCNR